MSDPTSTWVDTDANDDGALVTPGPLVTLGDVKSYLNYAAPTSTAADDGMLTQLLTAASDYIERMIGPISPTTYSELYDGWDGSCQLMLWHSPVISVSSVTEQWSTGGAHVLAQSVFGPGIDGYQIDPEVGHIVRVFQGNWPRTFFPGSLNIQVIYVAGYAVIPPVLQMACMELVAHWWTQGHQAAARGFGPIGEDPYDAVSSAPGAYSAVPYRIEDKLKLFRRPVLG